MLTTIQTIARRDALNALIDSAGSTFLAVEFTKQNGEHRTMQVQLYAGRNELVGDAADESRQRAVETRKANNPHLRNVFDVARRAWRSINLDTLTAVTVRGTRYDVASLA